MHSRTFLVEIRESVNHFMGLEKILDAIVVVRSMCIPSKDVLGTFIADFSEEVAKVD